MRATARASNSRRDTIASLAAKSSRTILIATGASSSRWVALRTTPMPPEPRKPSMRYFPPTIAPGPSATCAACGKEAGGAGISMMVLGKRCSRSSKSDAVMRYALDETRPEWIAGFCCYRLLLKAGSRDVQVRAVRELQRRGAALDARVERRIRRTRGHARADDSAAFDGYANVERRALRRGATTEPGA